MKNFVFALLLAVLMSSLCLAQSAGERRGWGYGFVAPGAAVGSGDAVATVHFGVGGERLLTGGLGLGADIGYLARLRDTGSGFGLLSVNAAYHFKRLERFSPFITGGGSLGFASGGSAGGGNFGGGVQYWFKERIALRLEFRDHIISSDLPNLVEFRFGIAFR